PRSPPTPYTPSTQPPHSAAAPEMQWFSARRPASPAPGIPPPDPLHPRAPASTDSAPANPRRDIPESPDSPATHIQIPPCCHAARSDPSNSPPKIETATRSSPPNALFPSPDP